MSEIPDDVMKAATALAARWFYEKWDPDDYICKLLVRYVAEDMMTQILAERERCAQAAISVICNRGGQRDDELIDAIRKGTAT